jgi:hypothetical protein
MILPKYNIPFKINQFILLVVGTELWDLLAPENQKAYNRAKNFGVKRIPNHARGDVL